MKGTVWYLVYLQLTSLIFSRRKETPFLSFDRVLPIIGTAGFVWGVSVSCSCVICINPCSLIPPRESTPYTE
ncbi:hypothetical protein VTH06DRAFT_3499 [Thermothelomyces fergusii]